MLSSETSDFFLLKFTSGIVVFTRFVSVPFLLLSVCPLLLLGEEDPLLFFYYAHLHHSHFSYVFCHVSLFVWVVRYQAIHFVL